MQIRLLSWQVSIFLFQAEDGIRDDLVTGVQTCALPICDMSSLSHEYASAADFSRALNEAALLLKKRFAHADRDAETDEHRSAVHRLREILSNQIGRASCRERG